MSEPATQPPQPPGPLDAEVRGRFGVLPNFFRLAPGTPEVTANLWGFARFGYLDLPLPPLFKERLFVYLSRFCEVRYCIARHVGFLVGLGRPSGDPGCPPEPVERVVRLIRRPLPRGDALAPHLRLLAAAPLSAPPASDTPTEEAVFACATHVFLQTPQAAASLDALRVAMGGPAVEHLLVFLAFVRTAHYWTRVHPELVLEDDITGLLAVHEPLAECVLNDPEAGDDETTRVLRDELASLRRERVLREEVERANRALVEADRRKDQWVMTLAHELRNPLAPIRNALELLRVADANPRAVGHAREMMGRQVGHLARIIEDLLDVSRLTRGRIELRPERLDLGRLARTVLEDHRAAFDRAGVALGADLPELPAWVSGDPTRLTQVLDNLLLNAVKFTDRGGSAAVRVEADPGRGQAVLAVRDTGVGIEPGLLPHLFETFTQADRSLARTQGGLGLGLSLVKGLVELHGGTVEARSDGPGRGAEFVVRLPLQPEPAAVAATPTALTPAAVRLRVLVVEDNRDAADSLKLLLEALGYEVEVAYTGVAGVEAAKAWKPDAVVCDIGLPGMDGYGVARELRRHPATATARLIAVTGYGGDEDRLKSREAGFDAHLTKPADPTALQDLLARTGSTA